MITYKELQERSTSSADPNSLSGPNNLSNVELLDPTFSEIDLLRCNLAVDYDSRSRSVTLDDAAQLVMKHGL